MPEQSAACPCKIEPSRQDASPAPQPASILLVEDEPLVRRLMANVLRHARYTLAEADSAEEAVRLTAEADTPFDLLVTDIVLPGASGPELFAKLRRTRPGLAVLYVSGYASDSEHARPLGVRYLQKPFGLSTLLAAVAEQLADERPAGVKSRAD